ITDPSEIHEDGANGDTTAYYVVKAVDSDGNPLAEQPGGTVGVSFTDGTATSGDDYTFSNTTVTVGTAFSAKSVDDHLSDSGENFVVSLNGGSYSEDAANTADGSGRYETVEYAPDTVTTTILDETETSTPNDNDSAFTLKLFPADEDGNIVTDPSEIHEDSDNGSTTAFYVVKAVDADGNPLAEQPGGTVEVTFTDGTANAGDDYTFGNTTVTVGTAFSAESVDDVLADNGENFVVSLNDGSYSEDAASTADGSGRYETVEYAPDTVTTTILDETDNDPATPEDNDSAFTLKLFPSDEEGNIISDPSEIHEDSNNGDTTAYYVVKAVDADGNPLADQPKGTVNVSFTDGSATTGDDYTYGNTTVTVGNAFSAESVDDALTDNNENFTVSLDSGSFSGADTYEKVEYAPDTVTTTILDDGEVDSAFTLKLFPADEHGNIATDPSEIHEDGSNGDTTAWYVVKAVGADGQPLAEQPGGTVGVSFTDGTAVSGDDYTAGNTTVTVGKAFSAESIDDSLSDSGENFVVSLDNGSYSEDAANTADGSGRYETVEYAPDTVTTTILDETETSTPNDNDSAFTLKLFPADEDGNIINDPSEIHEDGETSAYYVVKAVDGEGNLLADQPQGQVDVRFNNNSADGSDYSIQKTQVTLGEAFSATAKDDSHSDNGETFTVELVENSYSEDAAYNADGEYETVEYDDATVTTTIRDLDIAEVEDNQNTQENGDWDISILENLDQIHDESDFSSITISGIPDGATLKDGDGNTLTVNGGEYTATSWQDALDLTITPETDSSKDFDLDYQLTLQDGSVATFTQSVVITPEADQPWTLGDLEAESVTYNDTLLEDAGWVSLDAGWGDGSTVYQELTASTGDADGSESNTVVRFFSDGDTNLPNGTKLRFVDEDGNTETFTFNNSNNYVDIPADQLDTLQIRTPSNFNGELSLKIKTGVIDQDEDGNGSDDLWSDGGQSNQAWGVADTLTINVAGSADLADNLISATSVIDAEDSGRDQDTGALTKNADGTYDVSDAIDLEINFRAGQYTNTEVIEFKIENIPDDTYIFDKDGSMLNGSEGASLSEIKIVLDPSGGEHYTPQAGEIVLTSKGAFNNYVESLKLIPAHDSNEDFTLTLNQKSTEPNWDGSVGGEQSKEVTDTFEVQLTSVADSPIVSGTDTPIELKESGDWQDLSGFQISSGEDQHFSEDVYALIRNVPNDVGLRIVDGGGNELFDELVLANSDGSSTDWRIDNDTLQKIDSGEYSIQLKTPDADMSGSLEFGIRVTVLDVDPDTGQQTDTQVSDYTMNIVVQPEVEDYGDTQSSGNEDEWIDLNLNVGSSDGDVLIEGQYPYNGNAYDLKIEIPGLGETGEDIQIQGDNLVIDYANNTVYLNQDDLGSVEVLPPMHSNEDLEGIQFYRYLKDDIDDGSTPDEDVQEIVTGHKVVVSGVADGWEDTDNDENDTTDDVDETDYDGFIVQDISGDGADAVTGGKAISHVVIKFENGDTVKIDNYGEGGEINDYGHPQQYFAGLEQSAGSEVTSYLVKAGNESSGGGYFDPFTGEVVDPENYGFEVKNNGIVDAPSQDRSSLSASEPDDTGASDNIITALSDIVVRNHNVEDQYHDSNDTNPAIDTSESEYYIIQDQSGAGNTSWMVENGINAGGGVWVVPADSFNSASIKILQPGAGDGSLNLEIVPVSKEDDGDILFDQAHTFTIEYAGGDETIATGDGSSLVIDGSAPTITVSGKDSGLEDTLVEDVFGGTTASGGATISYVVSGDADNGSVDTQGMYQLPNGSFVGTGAIDFNPDAEFNGDAGFNVNIIATDSNGNQSFVSEDVILDIDPELDESKVSADGGTEIDDSNSERIDLNIQIGSSDADGSEGLAGDVTITPQDGGQLTGTGIIENADGSYTIAAENLDSVAFVPDAYTHGNFSFEITYTWSDTDANGSDDVSESVTTTFSISLASEVDKIDVNLTPSSGVNESEDYPLDLSMLQHDSDGSEIATVKISGVPNELIIQDANGNKIGNYSDNGDGTVDIVLKGSEVPDGGGLSLHDTTGTYGGEFTVDITAFSLDKVTHEIEQGTDNVTLTINPVASAITEVDAGSAQTDKISGTEDNAGMPLDLDVIMTDLDGSEKLQITFGDEFTNEGFSATYTDSDGNTQTLTDESLLTPDEAQSIQLIPDANYSGDFDLTVNVKSVEVDANGNVLDTLADAVSKTVQVIVNPEADSVTIDSISDQTVAEDTAGVDLGLNLSLDDASEELNLTLSGLEPGSSVSVAGQSVTVGGNGTVSFNNLTEADAETLSLTPPDNYSGTMNINVSVKTVDGNDVLDTAVSQSFSFEVTPEADDIQINSAGGEGAEDSAINLGLDFALVDSSELLDVTLSGQEPGSEISINGGAQVGTVNGDGSVTFEGLTLTQAESLQVTPPDNYSGTMDMHISVKTVDGTDVLDSPKTLEFAIEVTPDADQPDLDDPLLSDGVENDDGSFSYELDLSASLTDSSEQLSLRVDGIPDDCTLTNDNGDTLTVIDGSIVLTPDQLEGLTLTSPEELVSDGEGGLNIEATAISTEDDDSSAVQTKTIIDGFIDGLAYSTSSGLSGLTDSQGAFEYHEGDTVTFRIGDVVVGTATPDDMAQSNLFLQDLANVDRGDLNNEYVENMGVFLQSLDADGNPDNGITITPAVHAAFEGVSLNLSAASEEEVRDAIEQAGKQAITEEQAMDHVKRMLEQYGNQTEFDEHIDDSIETATFAQAPIDGLRYETSSGLSGEVTNGNFQFDENDTVDFYAGDQLVASINPSDIGDDGVITFEEAGFTVSLEEVKQLIDPDSDAEEDVSDEEEEDLIDSEDQDESEDEIADEEEGEGVTSEEQDESEDDTSDEEDEVVASEDQNESEDNTSDEEDEVVASEDQNESEDDTSDEEDEVAISEGQDESEDDTPDEEDEAVASEDQNEPEDDTSDEEDEVVISEGQDESEDGTDEEDDTSDEEGVQTSGGDQTSIVTANFSSEFNGDLRYETSSGLEGDLADGTFQFDSADTVEFYIGDQLVASFDSSAVGDDDSISFEEAGFVFSVEEIKALVDQDVDDTQNAESEFDPEADHVDELTLSEDAPDSEEDEEPGSDSGDVVVDYDDDDSDSDDDIVGVSEEADSDASEEEPTEVVSESSEGTDSGASEEEPAEVVSESSEGTDSGTSEEEPAEVVSESSEGTDSGTSEEEPAEVVSESSEGTDSGTSE
ncbi:Calx-beta domain-containing protein, partial [Oceanospirillum sediminis]